MANFDSCPHGLSSGTDLNYLMHDPGTGRSSHGANDAPQNLKFQKIDYLFRVLKSKLHTSFLYLLRIFLGCVPQKTPCATPLTQGFIGRAYGNSYFDKQNFFLDLAKPS